MTKALYLKNLSKPVGLWKDVILVTEDVREYVVDGREYVVDGQQNYASADWLLAVAKMVRFALLTSLRY
jgi:hypothetical protein